MNGRSSLNSLLSRLLYSYLQKKDSFGFTTLTVKGRTQRIKLLFTNHLLYSEAAVYKCYCSAKNELSAEYYHPRLFAEYYHPHPFGLSWAVPKILYMLYSSTTNYFFDEYYHPHLFRLSLAIPKILYMLNSQSWARVPAGPSPDACPRSFISSSRSVFPSAFSKFFFVYQDSRSSVLAFQIL